MEQGPEQKISFDKFLEGEVARVQSFEKLFELINRGIKVGILGDPKMPYYEEEARKPIEHILQKSERGGEITEEDFQRVTQQYGIRDAVMRLLNQQGLEKAA